MQKTLRTIQLQPLLLALLALILPFALVLVRWPDNFFADDSYFYFQVAWNLARGHGSTFNGLIPTNGYHPLWLLVCAGIEFFIPTKVAAIHAIGLVISLLNTATLAGVTALLRRAGVALPMIAWLLLLPWMFTSQLGTEGALSAMLFTATLLAAYAFAAAPTAGLSIAYALFAALTVLSRLDNFFIIVLLSVALGLASFQKHGRTAFRQLLLASPIAVVLWAIYLWSNHHYFGTWQPISGVLKSHNFHDHAIGSNLPHIAQFDLLVIAAGMAILAVRRRDLFFRVIELPVAAGVLVHALYIVFRMSNETRWSWYYTTWTILASLVLARLTTLLPVRVTRQQWTVLAGTAALLLVSAAHNRKVHGHDDPVEQDPGFQTNVVEGAHVTTLLAFDKPGRIAYYSTARIIPLDGLMGDLRFQEDLQAQGIAALDRRYHVDGFIGPPQPLTEAGKREFCDRVTLASVRFHCVADTPQTYRIDDASVFARLTGAAAGSIALPSSNMVWSSPGYVAVWRVSP